MKLLDWWGARRAEQERERRSMANMLTDEEKEQQPVPPETYLSAGRD